MIGVGVEVSMGRELPPPREPLSDSELGNLLAAVGNHEAKAITLLAMGDGRIYGSRDLHRAILSVQGETIGWRIDRRGPFAYCSNSLIPIGLVARELVNPDFPDSPWGYQITERGKSQGIPLCGLILDWSIKHDVSLMQLFGSTHSSSPLKEVPQTVQGEEEGIEFRKRAPMTTLKILYEVITSPKLPVRLADVADGIDEDSEYVVNHLERLSKAGLIQYQAKEANAPFSAYKLASSLSPLSDLPIYHTYKSLTHAVFAVLQEHSGSNLTIEEVYKLLPQELKEHRSKKPHIQNISAVLAYLSRNNYAESKRFHQGVQSEIDVTSDQRIVLTELLEIIDRFQDQDPEIVTRGRGLAEEIINNFSAVSALLRKVKEASPFANRSSTSETKGLVSYFISSHPGITNKEIENLLEQEGKKLGNERISQLTSMLVGEGSISVTQKGSVKKFFPRTSSGDV